MTIEEILYEDTQRRSPAGQCPVCGSLVYPPSFRCIRCQRSRP